MTKPYDVQRAKGGQVAVRINPTHLNRDGYRLDPDQAACLGAALLRVSGGRAYAAKPGRALKCKIVVAGGVMLGVPEDGYTKEWLISDADLATASDWQARVHEVNEEAVKYLHLLVDSGALNWTQMFWVWL